MDGASDPLLQQARATATAVRTTCPYCGVGCGVLTEPTPGGGMTVRGDPDHPANAGRLCSKGSALHETVGLEGRLLAPRVAGRKAGWDEALDLIAAKFRAAIDEHGPDSVAMYVSGQMLTEDYYVANKLMKGFIGSANIDTNSRLCMASSVAGHRRAFGTDTVPGQYEDIEQADVVVLVGSNLAWCHAVLYQRLAAARAARPQMRVVVIDPRRTATCDIADLHLAVQPGSDAALFNALLAEIASRGAVDAEFVADHVTGFEAALHAAQVSDPAMTGLDPAALRQFLDLWIGADKVVTVYSQGINQSSSGTDKVNAILNCHLATGRIGKAGCGPFSVTGQPNAMGGREAGGLANMLACHLELENSDHRAAVQTYWSSPRMADRPGLKAVDMFRAAAEGKIKALWIIHTNPVVSLPDADAVRAAIDSCDFVAVSDITDRTDTARLADVLLPAAAWGEKDGTVTNSERCISRQRPVSPAPGEARPDWWAIAQVAARMGWADAFDYDGPAAIYREYAGLSREAARLGSDFDISGHAQIGGADYDRMQPFTWPRSATRQGGRFFGDGQFHTPDRRGRMIAVTPGGPASKLSTAYPFRLNTGRVRDQWHTMTRTALSPRLGRHIGEPFVEINPADAKAQGLAPATLARVESPHGHAILRVLVTDRVPAGQLFVPMHWTGETASTARVNALVRPVTDPVSGQPDSKGSVARLRPFGAAWYGFALSGAPLEPRSDYWALSRNRSGHRAELAWTTSPHDWQAEARALFGLDDGCEVMSVDDPRGGSVRIAFVRDDRVIAALFAADRPVPVSRALAAALVGATAEPAVLAGMPGDGRPDPGATVCACFDVGVNTIRAAIRNQRLTSVDAIGTALRAGTNCGSCRSELAALLASEAE